MTFPAPSPSRPSWIFLAPSQIWMPRVASLACARGLPGMGCGVDLEMWGAEAAARIRLVKSGIFSSLKTEGVDLP
jgi:hypothetical protein